MESCDGAGRTARPVRFGAPMRQRAAVLLMALAAAGCGGASTHAPTTTAGRTVAAAAPAGLRVAVVGPLSVRVPGTVVVRSSLRAIPPATLVLVSARSAPAVRVAALAAAHPHTHYGLVGASTKGSRRPNLVGLVVRDDEAASAAGIVAGLVVQADGALRPRVAWIGPREPTLADAFLAGTRSVVPGAILLRGWSSTVPARCKEAALAAIGRGALVVAAHGGLCADAAIDAAHQQNLVGIRLGDFELPSVAASAAARDALAGVFHGNEDVVFGAASGAVGVRRLDPRIAQPLAVHAREVVQEYLSGLRS